MSDSFENTRILLIDDDVNLCRLIASYLQPLGYDVVADHNGPGRPESCIERAIRGRASGRNAYIVLRKVAAAEAAKLWDLI